MFFFRILLGIILALGGSAVQADSENDWRLVKDKSGIRVYQRSVPDSKMSAFRATMRVKGSFSSWVAMLDDVPAIADWMSNVKSARTIEKVSDTERFVYTVNDTPPPAEDRDLVARVIWSQDEKTGIATMSMTASPERMPLVPGLVRIPRMDGYWRLTPVGAGELEVEYYLHATPGGEVPAWIANLVARDHPYFTMKNARRFVKAAGYRQAVSSFIREPQALVNQFGE